ncbi:S-adenosylmethionine decarboxylase proenzyme [Echinococcus granulosus]|uniref:S-adenosylmethionine decarboxylase proenzyme n=1 Tax=Echinococcus granulosus TaxID=6210 RepID=W6UF40_ECHGR|nr:S-adenosylmethionine decarboxylase proenzyme [Echinococcus granulosus]EUB59728.1 S-adenosylmethionine decarboxylase proenzyme [Echinococcus granulosus]
MCIAFTTMPQLSPVHINFDMKKYEGAEKLLEIWFFYDEDRISLCRGCPNLLELKRAQIEHLLKMAHCEIVAEYHNKRQFSFILSESSLFITKNRIILKTCGQTQILQSLKPLIRYAMRLGFAKYVLYYSRRSFLFPELQAEPHGDFKNEVCNIFSSHFLLSAGAGYTLGRLNGDCWNFYRGQSTSAQLKEPPGQTLELMMRDLNPVRMEVFYARASHSAEEATKCSGIADLFPHGRVSSYLFTPCGYSANGLMNEDEYFTVHVTPEPEFSYVSFETNVAMDNYPAFISRVLDIFQPESFICTFFSDSSSTYSTHAILEKAVTLSGYCRCDLHSACMDYGRKLTFVKYFRVSDRSEGADAVLVAETMGQEVDSLLI